jgi:membrane protein required for beta-lactamase induction
MGDSTYGQRVTQNTPPAMLLPLVLLYLFLSSWGAGSLTLNVGSYTTVWRRRERQLQSTSSAELQAHLPGVSTSCLSCLCVKTLRYLVLRPNQRVCPSLEIARTL